MKVNSVMQYILFWLESKSACQLRGQSQDCRTFVLLRLTNLPCRLCQVFLAYIFSGWELLISVLATTNARNTLSDLSSRIANIPASVTTFRKSAPLKPSDNYMIHQLPRHQSNSRRSPSQWLHNQCLHLCSQGRRGS
jgi:hypothetical protein